MPGRPTILCHIEDVAEPAWAAAAQQGPAAVAQLLSEYHKQLTVAQAAWGGAWAERHNPVTYTAAIKALLPTYKQLLVARGRLEAALRGGGVSAAQRMRLLNLLGPTWWQLGSGAGPEQGLGSRMATTPPWPWPQQSSAGEAAIHDAGVGEEWQQLGHPWVAELWSSSDDGLLHFESSTSTTKGEEGPQQPGAGKQAAGLWAWIRECAGMQPAPVERGTTSDSTSSSCPASHQRAAVPLELWFNSPGHYSSKYAICQLAHESSSLGCGVPVPSVLFKGVRLQAKLQLDALAQQAEAAGGGICDTLLLIRCPMEQQLGSSMVYEARSRLWQVQRTAAAGLALQLLAQQGLLLPSWRASWKWGTAGSCRNAAGATSRCSTSSSTAGGADGKGSADLLPLFDAGAKSQQQVAQEQSLMDLVRGLPLATVEQVRMHQGGAGGLSTSAETFCPCQPVTWKSGGMWQQGTHRLEQVATLLCPTTHSCCICPSPLHCGFSCRATVAHERERLTDSMCCFDPWHLSVPAAADDTTAGHASAAATTPPSVATSPQQQQ
jgi:hypothetical protein